MESLGQIATVVGRQYRVKKSVTQQDVLNVQIEQSGSENRLAELLQKEASYRARLARLLHVDPHSNLQLTGTDPPNEVDFDLDSLIDSAVQNRPDLQSQLSMIQRDRKMIRLAELQRRPDFTVGLNWIATSSQGISPVANGDDSLLLGIGLNLPIYKSRIRAGICEAQANTMASTSNYESLKDLAVEEILDLAAKAESTQETLSLVREDIIPKSERTLKLSIQEYENSNIEYVQLIENWRTLLRYRLAEKRLESELRRILASLDRSVGNVVPQRPLVGDPPTVQTPLDDQPVDQ